MSRRADSALSRADFHAADGVLLVVRQPPAPPVPVPGQPAAVPGNPAEGVEILLAVWDDGSVTALHGHVDMGTGLRTALAQIVAEELNVPLAQVNMVLGDTARVPNQGATIASASLQIHAEPLRRAAAQARAWLLAQAILPVLPASDAPEAPLAPAELSAPNWLRLTATLSGQHVALLLDLQAAVKPVSDYQLVGQSVPRLDMLDKLTGTQVYVHDMRVPGMLHGRVVRPPYAGADHGEFIGNTLESVDEASIAHIGGIRAVVVIRDFVGIVAEREEQAEQALRELRVRWKPWPGMPDMQDVAQALRNNPSTRRQLVDEGDVDAALTQALAAGGQTLPRTYLWPYQMHASIGPSCAVADWHEATDDEPARLTVWAGTQSPFVLRFDLSRLMGVPDVAINVIRMEAAGCYGRNGADDVAADAALLSRAVGAPVRVQLTREQEHLWEPKGAAQLMEVQGGLTADGAVAAYDFQTSYPSNGAPTLALLLTRTIEPLAQAYEMGDRTARPPYAYDNLRVSVNDMAPLVRASWLRGVSAMPNSFAHESYIDELATAAGVDPVDYRLRYLNDPRAAELVRATADKALWRPRTQPQQGEAQGDILQGQGFAYARYIHSKWPGFGAAWAAWVADVEVNRVTGEVHVRRVVVGHDAGLIVNPAGIEQQIHGNVLQTTSRSLKEQVSFTPGSHAVANTEWGSYPILSFREVPVVEIVHLRRPDEPAMGAGESSSVPGTAAIANAIFDATGVRFRAPPFSPEVIRSALNQAVAQAPRAQTATQLEASNGAMGSPLADGFAPQAGPDAPSPGALQAAESQAIAASRRLARAGALPWPRRASLWARAATLLAGVVGLGAALLGWRAVIAPVMPSSATVYNEATLERGRQLAALGNCAGCHTADAGVPNTGGRPLQTPFGTVYSTNLTPDPSTGIGLWSFSAFQRAMREGVSRDGHHLYPAFPYTAFARTTDDDLTAIYAHLMAQTPVVAPTPPAQMRFPFSVRPLMAGWNALFHDANAHRAPQAAALPAAAAQAPGATVASSAQWLRGDYLVNSLGHCGACHTPRNALGAEKGGSAYLSGALVDGWEAPALTALSRAPVPWNADELFRYLRHGHTLQHGIATGPMAPIVRELGALPDADIRAMATYLASFQGETAANAQPGAEVPQPAQRARTVVSQAAAAATRSEITLPGPAQRLFNGACGACHHDGDGPRLLGLNLPLALSSKLHSERPDNLLQVILQGIQEPVDPAVGFMPGFRDSLSDAQIATLAAYMRQRYAPASPAWRELPEAVARLRR